MTCHNNIMINDKNKTKLSMIMDLIANKNNGSTRIRKKLPTYVKLFTIRFSRNWQTEIIGLNSRDGRSMDQGGHSSHPAQLGGGDLGRLRPISFPRSSYHKVEYRTWRDNVGRKAAALLVSPGLLP